MVDGGDRCEHRLPVAARDPEACDRQQLVVGGEPVAAGWAAARDRRDARRAGLQRDAQERLAVVLDLQRDPCVRQQVVELWVEGACDQRLQALDELVARERTVLEREVSVAASERDLGGELDREEKPCEDAARGGIRGEAKAVVG